LAQTTPFGPTPTPEGYGNPADHERQAQGFDAQGYRYKPDQAEDFQIILITSAPFTALASYGLTGLVSLALRDTFSVDGDYLIPFIVGTVAGSVTVASVSVLTNKYPAPTSASLPEGQPGEFKVTLPLAMARF
jgi:hypothetical protein